MAAWLPVIQKQVVQNPKTMNQKMLTDPNKNVSGGNVNTLRPQPLGLYIHIPYCIHKCGYCDFNSHLIDQDEMGAYVNALLV